MKFFLSILVIFASLVFVWLFCGLLFVAIILSNTPQSPKIKTEAIVVFTGADNRIREGLNLFALRRGDKIFISGIYKHLSANKFMEQWERQIALPLPCCIELGYQAKDTIGNADETRQWVINNNIKTLRLITSDYHMPRAYLELSNALPDSVTIYQHPVRSDQIDDIDSRFWHFSLLEYHKLIARLFHFMGFSQS